MLRASFISIALLLGGSSLAFAEDPMPSEGAGAPKAEAAKPDAPKTEAPKAEKAEKAGKKHHKNKARKNKPAAKKHKHHAKKAK